MDLSGAEWRKSTYSGNGSGGNCVEVAFLASRQVAVRDTKDRSLPPHLFTAAGWDAFLARVRAGEFDQR